MLTILKSAAFFASLGAVQAAELFSSANTIVSNVASSSDLSTLSQLMSQPDFASVLGSLSNSSTNDNFTLFAPSNEAFNAAGIDSNNKSAGLELLWYHILPISVNTTVMPQLGFPHTLLLNSSYVNLPNNACQVVQLEKNSSGVAVNDAKVTTADVNSSNGVIHIIDKVLTIPTSFSSTVRKNPNLSTFLSYFDQYNMTPTVDNIRGVTLFAPTNNAFDQMQATGNVSVSNLQSLLLYHIVNGTTAYSNSLQNGEAITTANGTKVTISAPNNETIRVNNALVTTPNVLLSNGVLHVIDSVLQPNATNETAINHGPTPNTNGTLSSPANRFSVGLWQWPILLSLSFFSVAFV